MRPWRTVALLICFFLAGQLVCQRVISPDAFDSAYNRVLSGVNTDSADARRELNALLTNQEGFSPVQKARIRFLKFCVIRSDKKNFIATENLMYSAPDSLSLIDSLIYSSSRYLERSMPDKAIPLLLQDINMLPENSDKSQLCNINLCEAYRQKQEYAKGISMLYELLTDKSGLSDDNRAFAYNRLAALYNEWGYPRISYTDSVLKYSVLCITISEKIDSKPNLAAAQNELSFQFLRRKEYDKALELSVKSVGNFLETGKTFHAMNALINQSYIYMAKKEYEHSLLAIEEAIDMSEVDQNRNLYLRLYSQFARICQLMGKYNDALELLRISYQLQSDFFKDRINLQINEQSAKYDLLVKEQKIKEAEGKNAFRQRQLVLLIIITVTLFIAFLTTLFYFRLKRKEIIRQKLMEAVAETEAQERKRIARDLHDGVGPVLSAINHYFQAFLDAKEADKQTIQTRLQQVISEAIDEVSRISHNISPHILENSGLVPALKSFIAPLSKNDRLKIDFDPGLTERFDLKKELTVYRCITELINNTMKHAGATQISLSVFCKERILYVIYSDNGKGFDPDSKNPEGMGLYNIRHRIESFGGRVSIESAYKKGTKTRIELPI
ncbi:MAG: sensor histidine kinase [Bacteroidales bacterium]|nr:sensor histidine kinase [Bacteroidales bacterium]